MNRAVARRTVAIAFSNGADLISSNVVLSGDEEDRLNQFLSWFQELGHIAAYSIAVEVRHSWAGILGMLRARLGSLAAAATRGLRLSESSITAPTYLMRVGPFDHELEGAPTAVAHLLGLDLELIATRSSDEEYGAHLPGRDGLWLIHARPMF